MAISDFDSVFSGLSNGLLFKKNIFLTKTSTMYPLSFFVTQHDWASQKKFTSQYIYEFFSTNTRQYYEHTDLKLYIGKKVTGV